MFLRYKAGNADGGNIFSDTLRNRPPARLIQTWPADRIFVPSHSTDGIPYMPHRPGATKKYTGDTMKEYILIAEDDNDISQMLSDLLTYGGYRIRQAFSGTEALLYVKEEAPAAMILDLMLPGLSGEQVLSAIKTESPQTAVIVASAKEDVGTRISLLRQGADDYLTKPFDTGELLARLEAVLRRSRQTPLEAFPDRPASPVLRYKDLSMYPEDFSAFVGDQELSLTRREYLILELLMGNPRKVFTKSNIYESVWNEEFLGEDNAVNVHISNIRQKLSRLNPGESYIQTVWGIGFKMK